MESSERNKVFFASDFHLGVDGLHGSHEREQRLVNWLTEIAPEAKAIYLLGDVFDFWFEYKHVVPKGYVRILGKLAELSDAGIDIHFFIGNHDMWMFKYFEEELNIKTHRKPIRTELLGHNMLIGHGDGLGPGDHGYKRLKRVFANKWNQKAFSWFHPDLGIKLAAFWSAKSRDNQHYLPEFLGQEKEWLAQYANRKLEKEDIDFFVFGHRHLVIDMLLKNGKSRYINTGDWLYNYSYAVLDKNGMSIEFYDDKKGTIYS